MILTVNMGSSTCKCALFSIVKNSVLPDPLWEKKIEWNKKNDINSVSYQIHNELKDLPIKFICHRVVHGGKYFFEPTLLDKKTIKKIQSLNDLAPLHNPLNVKGILAFQKAFSNTSQYACFDTAFHRDLPKQIYTYPIPLNWLKKGIRKYGFHGISFEYCINRYYELTKKTNQKIICCHLGSGCSAASIQGYSSLNTTMGFTPLDGLMMGTRSGTIDTSAVTYLMKKKTMQDIEKMLFTQSGLKGIYGKSSDMRTIEDQIVKGNDKAQLAYDLFLEILVETLGKLFFSLGGMDTLIFTGGIGENMAKLRFDVCNRLKVIDCIIDEKKNKQVEQDMNICATKSKKDIFVIYTKENWQMAKNCFKYYSIIK
ncbi:putative propionate kinase [Candidatus Rubidus massiliensis]|nr:putative propionate kinase [Candidatus Rubidus massiliensis]